MFGILAGTLNGAAFGRDLVDFNADAKTTTNTGQFILCFDVKAFMDPVAFHAEIDKVREEMTASPPRPGFSSIRLPGDRVLAIERERLRDGIPMRPALPAALWPVSDAAGVTPLEDRV